MNKTFIIWVVKIRFIIAVFSALSVSMHSRFITYYRPTRKKKFDRQTATPNIISTEVLYAN